MSPIYCKYTHEERSCMQGRETAKQKLGSFQLQLDNAKNATSRCIINTEVCHIGCLHTKKDFLKFTATYQCIPYVRLSISSVPKTVLPLCFCWFAGLQNVNQSLHYQVEKAHKSKTNGFCKKEKTLGKSDRTCKMEIYYEETRAENITFS